jgi:hypothetical protein
MNLFLFQLPALPQSRTNWLKEESLKPVFLLLVSADANLFLKTLTNCGKTAA